MTFLYYEIIPPFVIGPGLFTAAIQSQDPWTTPRRITKLLGALTSLDFSNYDSRRLALERILALPIPQFFNTGPFDILQHPLIPPFTQVRFPSTGVFVNLADPDYARQLAAIQAALSYRDGDPDYQDQVAKYQAAVAAIQTASFNQTAAFSRVRFELENTLLWDFFPPAIPKLCPTPQTSQTSPSTL
jgi:hypothetical protein